MPKLVLWGHHVDEYCEMFDLSVQEMKSSWLEYGCGPTAVNVELSQTGQKIISIDPLFDLGKEALESKVATIFSQMVKRVYQAQESFDFSRYGSAQSLVKTREIGIANFLADYQQGKKEKCYQGVRKEHLNFADFSFEFALSSHYFFVRELNLDADMHLQQIKELARVAKEVRIFPLIDRHGQPSSLLGPVLLGLQQANFGTEIREVAYHLQTSGNAMLRVWAQECRV